MRPPSGAQHRLRAGTWSAIVTEVGAALRVLRAGDREVIDGFAEEEMCTGYRGLPLLPWPNRIADGSYTFEGVTHQLPIDRPREMNAIHGLTCWRSWRVVEDASGDPARVVLALDLRPQPGYPFALDLTVAYALGARGLTVTIRAANIGAGNAPFGAGHHPYFLPRTTLDAARVRLVADRVLESDARGLPVTEHRTEGTSFDLRAGRPIGGTRFDHCFGALARDGDGLAHVAVDDLDVWMDERFGWVQLFTGDTLPEGARRRSLAIEPMSCPPNAFRSGRDLLTLHPGDAVTLRWGVSLAGAT